MALELKKDQYPSLEMVFRQQVYGPGIAIDCPLHRGLHYWHDHLIFEIIDPSTGRQLPKPPCGRRNSESRSQNGYSHSLSQSFFDFLNENGSGRSATPCSLVYLNCP